jgi:hypothetical protein
VANPPESDSEVPRQFPNVTPPQDLHPTSDIRFVMIELGKVSTKLDRLINDVGEHGKKIGALEKTVDRVWTGAIVAGVVISASMALFWWALGDRISTAVHAGLFPSPVVESRPAPQPSLAPVPNPRRP